jgi:hypothetical protein
MLYDRLFRHSVRIPEAFDNWERDFRVLPVYDVTSIYQLGADGVLKSWESLPKRLPHSPVWMEWESEHSHAATSIKVKFGLRIDFIGGTEAIQHVLPEFGNQIGNFYVAIMFGCVISAQGAHPNNMHTIGVPFIVPNIWYIALDEEWVGVRQAVRSVSANQLALEKFSSDFLYTPWSIPRALREETANDCWPAFAAGALLHCRNIVTETVGQDKKHPMVRGEREHRPYCSYKVLKLEVPRRMAERNGDDIEGGGTDDPKVRFHLCRGHFKNLQHPRYNVKGWHWWPAHWKGSIELGRADKSYKLAAAKE